MSGTDGPTPDRPPDPPEPADAPVTLANLDAILAARRPADIPSDDDAPPPDPVPEAPPADRSPSDDDVPPADAATQASPEAATAVPGPSDPAPDPADGAEGRDAVEPTDPPDSLAPSSTEDDGGEVQPKSVTTPPTWTELERTDPHGSPPVAPAQPTVALRQPPPAGGNNPGASGVAAKRTQPAVSPRDTQGVVLTIPWPRVPTGEESDPRRRIPIGAILTGILGELLITAGAILGLYVVWELYWSTVEARPAQAHALEVVHIRPEYVPPVTVDEVGPTPTFAPEYTDTFPVADEPVAGQPWLSLHVPRWGYGYNVAIAEGTGDSVIHQGLIGHYPETENAGEMGNFATAAHRITHGEPYARIQELQDGDELIVETDENYLVYEVYDSDIVLPTDMSVIWPVPGQAGVAPERRLITLTTCHPRYTSTHRYIVWGELQYWTKKSEGPLRALTPPSQRGEGG
jgi:sortase A